jgi:Transposase DDE domain group 1
MLTRGQLGFQYESEKKESNLTSFAGLPLYLELGRVAGLWDSINNTLQTKSQGWSDLETIVSLLLLNIAGGDCVEDIKRLESDKGLQTLLLKFETQGMKRKERREYERRWHKRKERALPSASSIRRYLEQFHNESEESCRVKGSAFIPEKNQILQQLSCLNAVLISFAQDQNKISVATLDQDATLAKTAKRSALYCYEKYKGYQPLNTYWHEQGLVLHSEFRDGNVPAGFQEKRVLEESLNALPDGVKKVFLRTDTAGYQVDLLQYCARGENKRFGVIEFAISSNVSSGFKLAVSKVKASDWKTLYVEDSEGNRIATEQEWAEVCFVPYWAYVANDEPAYRYLAIREKLVIQEELALSDVLQMEFSFQTMEFQKSAYRIFGLVTNRTINGNELINWHRKRCGESERIHSVEKSELAGGQFPSNKFGANAAWWHIMVMALNLNVLMKRFALPKKFKNKGLKAIRFHIIGIPGRMVKHARNFVIKLADEAVTLLNEIRDRILELERPPPYVLTG